MTFKIDRVQLQVPTMYHVMQVWYVILTRANTHSSLIITVHLWFQRKLAICSSCSMYIPFVAYKFFVNCTEIYRMHGHLKKKYSDRFRMQAFINRALFVLKHVDIFNIVLTNSLSDFE